ncbi:MAG: hypothetical protein ACFHVJ_00940 [Aestuariibacter sp.]
MFKPVFLFVCFILALSFSPFAAAANEKIQWQLYMVIITVISAVGAYVVANRKKDYEARAVKILAIGVYFWVFTFAQLGLLSLLYYAL